MLRVGPAAFSHRSTFAHEAVSLAARTMLFKTISASVYGIDAYLVEVEVDVGSARMTDFNVVGFARQCRERKPRTD